MAFGGHEIHDKCASVRKVDGQTARAMDWPALDYAKFLCVVGMVLAHGFFWTWTVAGRFLLPPESPWFSAFQFGTFLGFFPLTLPLLAGASYRLRLGATRSSIPALLWRCSLLAVVGYAMNVLAAGWYTVWAWNVLQLVALAFLVIEALYVRGSVWWIAVLALLILVLNDPLHAWFPPGMRGPFLRVVLGDDSDWHTWPVFPWLATVAAGFVLAHGYQSVSNRAMFTRTGAIAGVVLLVVAVVAGQALPPFDPQNLIGPRMMVPPMAAILGLLGVALLLLSALTAVQGRLHFSPYGIVSCFSAGILWIYVIHMIVGVRLSRWIFSYVYPGDVVADPWQGWHPFILFGFPILLVLVSWLVGYIVVRGLHGKRLSVRLRKVAVNAV